MPVDTRDERRWLKRFGRRDLAEIRLLCFHCAGGNASMYRDWTRWTPASIEPIAVQLPGRLDRFGEAPYENMDPLVDKLADVIEPLLDQPFACYGASMGAQVAWALTHALRDRAMPMPRKLYIASSAAPGAEEPVRGWNEPDSRLVQYMVDLGGTPPEILAEPDLLARLLPMLRADLTVLGTHALRPAAPLEVPIRAFAGREDVEASPERMSAWRAETCARFDLDVVAGGHFFTPAGQRQVIEVISDELARADEQLIRPGEEEFR
jgi:medium-chain acyl-[acyl-carrier-protein] hydrolase